MEQLLQIFKPWDIQGITKIRLGPPHDGGYILPKELLSKCNQFLSFGIGDSYKFDSDLAEFTNKPVHMYDHTVSLKITDPRLIFIKKGLAKTSSDTMVSLPELIKDHPVFVKMDIESDEWKVFDDTKGISILVIEIHGFLELENFPHYKQREKMLYDLHDEFLTYHTHINNWGPSGKIGRVSFGHVMEVTFVNRKWLKEMGCVSFESTSPLPIPGLDAPNCHWVEDHPLSFG